MTLERIAAKCDELARVHGLGGNEYAATEFREVAAAIREAAVEARMPDESMLQGNGAGPVPDTREWRTRIATESYVDETCTKHCQTLRKMIERGVVRPGSQGEATEGCGPLTREEAKAIAMAVVEDFARNLVARFTGDPEPSP